MLEIPSFPLDRSVSLSLLSCLGGELFRIATEKLFVDFGPLYVHLTEVLVGAGLRELVIELLIDDFKLEELFDLSFLLDLEESILSGCLGSFGFEDQSCFAVVIFVELLSEMLFIFFEPQVRGELKSGSSNELLSRPCDTCDL